MPPRLPIQPAVHDAYSESVVRWSDTFGHSLAFFEKYCLVRLAADGGMRKADAMIRQPI